MKIMIGCKGGCVVKARLQSFSPGHWLESVKRCWWSTLMKQVFAFTGSRMSHQSGIIGGLEKVQGEKLNQDSNHRHEYAFSNM